MNYSEEYLLKGKLIIFIRKIFISFGSVCLIFTFLNLVTIMLFN